MSGKMIDVLGQVKGCTVYCAPDGIPEEYPATIDAEISLPQITHPTSTMQSMGDMDVADQTRVNPMVTTISCEPGVIQSKLLGYGVQNYVCRWAQEIKKANGDFDLIPFVAYISGIPSEDVSSTVKPGENTTGTISINTFKYRLLCDGKEIRYVDKTKGILKINGVDYRSKLNSML